MPHCPAHADLDVGETPGARLQAYSCAQLQNLRCQLGLPPAEMPAGGTITLCSAHFRMFLSWDGDGTSSRQELTAEKLSVTDVDLEALLRRIHRLRIGHRPPIPARTSG